MAYLFRIAKSGSDWTTNELLAYNIRVSSQTPHSFYGIPLPPVASLNDLDPDLVSGTLSTQVLKDETYRLLQYLDLASTANAGQESAINDFAREILRVLGGDPDRSAQTDVTLIHGSSTILLVVQEDKTTVSARDPEAQVIAEAIATFQYNNRTRARLGQHELDTMTIPCITMIGTRPIFYLVPVTQGLSQAVATAQYPTNPTVVKKCVVASNSCRLSEGMETVDFRQVALQHYTAFRTLAESHWSAFIFPKEMGA